MPWKGGGGAEEEAEPRRLGSGGRGRSASALLPWRELSKGGQPGAQGSCPPLPLQTQVLVQQLLLLTDKAQAWGARPGGPKGEEKVTQCCRGMGVL